MIKSYDQRLLENFYGWEVRGRGWAVYPEPVDLEPAFRPFDELGISFDDVPDDGRRPSLFTHVVKFFTSPWKLPSEVREDTSPVEPYPEAWEPAEVAELQLAPSGRGKIPEHCLAQSLQLFSRPGQPFGFELVGNHRAVTAQLVVPTTRVDSVQSLLASNGTDASPVPEDQSLKSRWRRQESFSAVIEFGLAQEFMWGLPQAGGETLAPLVSALACARENEFAVFQVLAQPASHAWGANAFRSLHLPGTDGAKPLFRNCRELVSQAQQKFSAPLFAALVRIGLASPIGPRVEALTREVVAAMRMFSGIRTNELWPLPNDEYDPQDHESDLLERCSRRTGMLLNLNELTRLFHVPELIFQPRFSPAKVRTKAIPVAAQTGQLLLGHNTHAGQTREVRLSAEARVQHVHILGASGMGKSSLLLSMLKQDLEQGMGFLLLDPHGDLVDQVLAFVPPNRRDDVILLDPADEEYPVSFNVLSAHSDLERTVLASDLVGIFRRYATSWGDQMTSVFGNAILAFLENTRPGSLLDLRRFLLEPGFRHEVLASVTDPDIAYFWRTEFPVIKSGSLGPLLTRIDTFLRPKLIRFMVGQKENRLDFASIMNSGKVVLAKLSQGLLGEENAFLLGSLIVARVHQTAIGRQNLREAERKPFYLYMDEFQNFITPSLSTILSGARKYRLGLILAHQDLRQLERDRDVASAVLANPYTRLCFRLADEDAKRLADGFSFFGAEDLINLGRGEAIGRMERSANDFSLRTCPPPVIDPATQEEALHHIRSSSRRRYAVPRAKVEEAFRPAEPEKRIKEAPMQPVSPAPPLASKPPPPVVPPEPPTAVPVSVPPAVTPIPEPPRPVNPPPPESKAFPTMKSPVGTPASPPVPKASRVATPGRGGAEHKEMQQVLKRWGSELGFVVDVEKQVEGGSVDVHFERGDKRIACEICLTKAVKRDVALLAHRVKHGFFRIFVVSTSAEHLRDLRAVVEASFSEAEVKLLRFCPPDDMKAHLMEIAAADATREVIQHGRKVRVSFSAVSPEANAAAQEAIIKAVAETKKRKPRKKEK